MCCLSGSFPKGHKIGMVLVKELDYRIFTRKFSLAPSSTVHSQEELTWSQTGHFFLILFVCNQYLTLALKAFKAIKDLKANLIIFL